MRRHIFWALFGMSMVVLVVLATASAFVMHRSILRVSEHDVTQECAVVAAVLDASQDPVRVARGLPLDGIRLTLLEADGTVLFDSATGSGRLENHLDRPEVLGALESGTGFSTRESSTLMEVMLYAAHRLDDGSVVRLGVARDSVLAVFFEMAALTVALALVVAGASAGVATRLSRRLVAPLEAIDPRHPAAGEGAMYAEVAPLLQRIGEQHAQIEEQMLRLTDNDRMRVEFTANVTHELKTPLTVISGYAELIETGIAAPEDAAGFAGRIHEEAGHLTAIVNDILILSRMDEAERADAAFGVMEPVDLGKLSAAVVERLRERAHELDVAVTLKVAGDVLALGIPKLVDQIVYNLCDNALRYNRPGGTVTVHCGVDRAGRPFVSVADTGIGIADEHQEKVFNRFFRVDAGRSRETGGTGLGLAIVKHAARCCSAELQIESALGVGTAIVVTFCPAAPTGRRDAAEEAV